MIESRWRLDSGDAGAPISRIKTLRLSYDEGTEDIDKIQPVAEYLCKYLAEGLDINFFSARCHSVH